MVDGADEGGAVSSGSICLQTTPVRSVGRIGGGTKRATVRRMELVLIILLVVIAALYLFNKLTFPPRVAWLKGLIETIVVVLTLLWLVLGFWTPPSWGPLSHHWNREEPPHYVR